MGYFSSILMKDSSGVSDEEAMVIMYLKDVLNRIQ